MVYILHILCTMQTLVSGLQRVQPQHTKKEETGSMSQVILKGLKKVYDSIEAVK